MKKYEAPKLNVSLILQKENITSLNNWLETGGDGYNYANANLTTCELES